MGNLQCMGNCDILGWIPKGCSGCYGHRVDDESVRKTDSGKKQITGFMLRKKSYDVHVDILNSFKTAERC